MTACLMQQDTCPLWWQQGMLLPSEKKALLTGPAKTLGPAMCSRVGCFL